MLSWKRLATTVLFIGAGAGATACGDNITPGGPIDANPSDIDANTDIIDASVPPDAMLDTFEGTITVLEASVLGVPQLGQGIQVAASFYQTGTLPAPIFDTNPGFPIGCKVTEYTPTQAADVGLNEGAISIVVDNNGEMANVQGPAIPTCIFVPTKGYLCPDDPTCLSAPGATCLGGTIAGVSDGSGNGTCVPGALALIDADAPFTFSVTDGRYVSFAGSGSALLPDGAALPVVNKVDDTTIVLANPGVTSTTCIPPTAISATALHLSLGGVGPIPGVPDPGFLADSGDVSITLTSGGDGDIPTFTADFPYDATAGSSSGAGDDFTLDGANTAVLGDIPLDGSSFTISCTGQTGCGAGTGDGLILSITTTDGDITGLGGTTMPPPTTKRVSLRCAQFATSLTVPAEASAYLMNSGATRLQATLIRGELGGGGDGVTSNVNVVTGHAITTFKTPVAN